MTQRNIQNPRNTGDGPKGQSRKSASSAKLKSKAASSVYVRTKGAKDPKASKGKSQEPSSPSAKRRAAEAERMRRREQVLAADAKNLPEYKFWRRIWAVGMGVAIACVAGAWIPEVLINTGALPLDFQSTSTMISTVCFIVALVAIGVAFFCDLVKIRKIQKAEEERAHTLSKAERDALDKRIDEMLEAEQKAQHERDKNSILPWKRKKALQAEEEEKKSEEDKTDAKGKKTKK